jgi:AcrR family transcriptional regulator
MDVKSSDKDDSDTNVAADARGASNRNGSNPRKELVRDQLIGIAAELFESKGFDQTSMNDIAQALGLGRSAVYHYFRNKEEILAGLVESESRTPSHELEAIRAAPDLTASEKLRRAIVTGACRKDRASTCCRGLSRRSPTSFGRSTTRAAGTSSICMCN